MTALVLLPIALGLVLAGGTLAWPVAYRAGARSSQRDQAEIARILDGVETPTVRPAPMPTEWVRPRLGGSEQIRTYNPPPRIGAHASPWAASSPKSLNHVPKHAAGQMVRAHLAAADAYIGRPRELVA